MINKIKNKLDIKHILIQVGILVAGIIFIVAYSLLEMYGRECRPLNDIRDISPKIQPKIERIGITKSKVR